MPFEELETFTKYNARPEATLSYTPRAKGLALVISVPDEVFEITVPESWFEQEPE